MYFLPVMMVFLSLVASIEPPYVPLECDEPKNGTLQFREPNTTAPHECKPDGSLCRAETNKAVWFICDADDFCSLKWMKNDTYPYRSWSRELREVELYENDETGENRLVFRRPDGTYNGKYSCFLSNGTHNISRDFLLYAVCDSESPYIMPKVHQTGGACMDQEVEIGQDAVLYCEFCTRSKFNHTFLKWLKLVSDPLNDTSSRWVSVDQLNVNGTVFAENRTELDNCGTWNPQFADPKCTESMDSVGSYLHIREVTQEAFGQYKLEAIDETTERVGETNPIALREKKIITSDKTAAVLGALVGILLAVVVSGVLWLKFNLDIKLFVRDRFSEVESRGDRDYDAYIVYDSSSVEITRFITELIGPKLTENNYEVFIKDIHMIPGGYCAEDIVDAINSSLRCILVVTGGFPSDQGQYLELQLDAATKDMADKKTKIIPILFGDVNVTALGSLLVVLRCLRFKESRTNKSKFLKRLLLRMPVKSRNDGDSLIQNMELQAESGADE